MEDIALPFVRGSMDNVEQEDTLAAVSNGTPSVESDSLASVVRYEAGRGHPCLGRGEV